MERWSIDLIIKPTSRHFIGKEWFTREFFLRKLFWNHHEFFGINSIRLLLLAEKEFWAWNTLVKNGIPCNDWVIIIWSNFNAMLTSMKLAAAWISLLKVLFSPRSIRMNIGNDPQNGPRIVGRWIQLDRNWYITKEMAASWTPKSVCSGLVNELNGFDNFFFWGQNEPWSDRGRSV